MRHSENSIGLKWSLQLTQFPCWDALHPNCVKRSYHWSLPVQEPPYLTMDLLLFILLHLSLAMIHANNHPRPHCPNQNPNPPPLNAINPTNSPTFQPMIFPEFNCITHQHQMQQSMGLTLSPLKLFSQLIGQIILPLQHMWINQF